MKFCYNWSMEIQELQLAGDSVEDVVGVLIDGGCGLVLELVVAGVWWGSCTGGTGRVLVRLVRHCAVNMFGRPEFLDLCLVCELAHFSCRPEFGQRTRW